MIDPEKITNFNRTDSELEELILFAVLVAGKNARTQALKLHDFLGENVKQPFKFISSLITADSLIDVMQHHGLGKYNLLEKSFTELIKRFSDGKLRTATVDELEQVPGIGMKTARFFVVKTVRLVLLTHTCSSTWQENIQVFECQKLLHKKEQSTCFWKNSSSKNVRRKMSLLTMGT
jgi:DNA repair protein RadC